eukprot:748336-Hanusia_phi.AAC.3
MWSHLQKLRNSALLIRRGCYQGQRKFISFPEDRDPVELVKEGPRPELNVIRKESLRLYREILRAARHFTWADKDGKIWRDKLIASARKEFEDARYEKDPEIISRLLIGGRSALEQVTDRMAIKARKLIDEEQQQTKGLHIPGQKSAVEQGRERDEMAWKLDWHSRHNIVTGQGNGSSPFNQGSERSNDCGHTL